jgi:tocopherol O-methyltransferase
VDPREDACATPQEIGAQLVAAQERMLERACDSWEAARTLQGELMDVGCGLGGSCLYFAERYGARVTGLTPIPGHVPWIQRFAIDAGVEKLVSVELGDAHTVPGKHRFDAAFSFGASNYFDRSVWFRRLASLLRPGGHVCIEDTFLVDERMAAPFNAYWISNIGRREEYIDAARAAGFELVRLEDVTQEAAGFWRLSIAHSRRLLDTGRLEQESQRARHRSIEWQRQFYQAYLAHDVENLLVSFRKIA